MTNDQLVWRCRFGPDQQFGLQPVQLPPVAPAPRLRLHRGRDQYVRGPPNRKLPNALRPGQQHDFTSVYTWLAASRWASSRRTDSCPDPLAQVPRTELAAISKPTIAAFSQQPPGRFSFPSDFSVKHRNRRGIQLVSQPFNDTKIVAFSVDLEEVRLCEARFSLENVFNDRVFTTTFSAPSLCEAQSGSSVALGDESPLVSLKIPHIVLVLVLDPSLRPNRGRGRRRGRARIGITERCRCWRFGANSSRPSRWEAGG
jgi:hypothetical protein